jgi:adenylyltransferase/sulfurtransferase
LFQLSSEPINRQQLIGNLQNEKAGAIVFFEGWVRNHNEGKQVSSLEYQVYEELAVKEGQKILKEAKHLFNLHEITCSHRYGHLNLGDTAVIVAATASHRDDAFKASRYVIDEIKLRLPIWKKEHYVSHDAEWVFCKDHHTHVHFKENEYYRKQADLVDQAALKNAHVLVVGAGGLGCPVLTSLTAAGVGHIDVVDFDKISISNIHRQSLFTPDSVGEEKVDVARKKLSALNPFIHIHSHHRQIHAGNVEDFVQNKNLVLDCTDNLETKFLLHDACFKHGIPLISASLFRFEGQVRTFVPALKKGCLRCSYEKAPADYLLGNCNDFGVLGASAAATGAVQASEAILFLSNGTNNTIECTFLMNLKDLSQMKIKNFKKPECQICEGKIDIVENDLELETSELTSDCELIDIREKDDSFLETLPNSDKKRVLFCNRGVRSKRLVSDLRLKGVSNIYSLRGGAQSLI